MYDMSPRYRVSLARTDSEVRAAQRLRYDVFVAELGAKGDGIDHAERIECDQFDPVSDHLLLYDLNASSPVVVGVYRLMTRAHAETAGRFYSQDEFHLAPLLQSDLTLLELGRSCLHPAHRGGAALMTLWQGLAAYVAERSVDILFGTASFHGTDLITLQQPISHLHASYLAPEALRVTATMTPQPEMLGPDQIDRKAAMRATPALIKSYLKLGGVIGQGVYVDHAFNTTDVCLILETRKITSALFDPGQKPPP